MDNIIQEILSSQFGVPINKIIEETDIVNDLKADSIDIVEVIMTLEKAYKIKIEEGEYEDKLTVGRLYDLIKSKL